jgi:hypothetical protein
MAHVGGFAVGALAATAWRLLAGGPPRRRLPPPRGYWDA